MSFTSNKYKNLNKFFSSRASRKNAEPIYEDVVGAHRDESDNGVGTGPNPLRKISKFGSKYYEGEVTVSVNKVFLRLKIQKSNRLLI
jgi:hypothetical protein